MSESPQRRAWRMTEPIHAMIYFVPEAPERYGRLGVGPQDGYFASRGAAFGPVGAGTISATFYHFNPDLVGRAVPAVWSRTTPAAMTEARLDAVDAALTRGLGADALASPEMAEAAELARRAAEAATARPQGRPLFAAHAELPWPAEPHLVLWHAQTLLREFRGDGHIAALLTAGVSGIEALILHVASGEADERFLRISRGWRRDTWTAAVTVLRERGLLTADDQPGAPHGAAGATSEGAAGRPAAGSALALTDAGRESRARIEETTDRLAAPAYDAIGAEACLRLAELARPMSRALVKAGMLDPAQLTGEGRS